MSTESMLCACLCVRCACVHALRAHKNESIISIYQTISISIAELSQKNESETEHQNVFHGRIEEFDKVEMETVAATPIENQHLPNDKNRKIYHPYCSRFCTHPIPLICLTIHPFRQNRRHQMQKWNEGKNQQIQKLVRKEWQKNILKATITPLIVIPHTRPLSTHVAFCMQKF